MPQNPLGTLYVKNSVSGVIQPALSDAEGNLLTSVAGTAVFMAANPSGVTTSAGLATTYVGIVLSNPAGAAVSLYLRRFAGQSLGDDSGAGTYRQSCGYFPVSAQCG